MKRYVKAFFKFINARFSVKTINYQRKLSNSENELFILSTTSLKSVLFLIELIVCRDHSYHTHSVRNDRHKIGAIF